MHRVSSSATASIRSLSLSHRLAQPKATGSESFMTMSNPWHEGWERHNTAIAKLAKSLTKTQERAAQLAIALHEGGRALQSIIVITTEPQEDPPQKSDLKINSEGIQGDLSHKQVKARINLATATGKGKFKWSPGPLIVEGHFDNDIEGKSTKVRLGVGIATPTLEGVPVLSLSTGGDYIVDGESSKNTPYGSMVYSKDKQNAKVEITPEGLDISLINFFNEEGQDNKVQKIRLKWSDLASIDHNQHWQKAVAAWQQAFGTS